MNLHAYVLRFHCQAVTEVATPPYKGSMLRGALFAALRHDFCLDQRGPACMDCHLRSVCPVCCLLATADEDSPRGLEVVRPCTIEPPLDGRTLYRPGDELTFGLTLFGDAADLLPYAVMGVWRMGELGIGNQRRAPGRFAVRRVEAVDPISGRSQELYRQGEERVRRSDIPITHAGIAAVSQSLGVPSAVTLALLTPLRLVVDSTLVKRLTFPILMRRLLRRLTDLCQTATDSHPGFDYETLLALAESVRVAEDRTLWLDVASYSHRQGRSTPIGGLMGTVTFEGDLAPFVPWLLWGSITHVGKNATKGDGWYRLSWQS